MQHTRDKIYPTISFYKSMQQIINSDSKAYDLIAYTFNGMSKRTNNAIKAVCKIPFVYKLVPKVMANIIHTDFGKKCGFDMLDRKIDKTTCHIDMIACPYYNNCVRYECAELAAAFCNSDDIAYRNMHPKLFWGRKKTLARVNDCCDFILKIT